MSFLANKEKNNFKTRTKAKKGETGAIVVNASPSKSQRKQAKIQNRKRA